MSLFPHHSRVGCLPGTSAAFPSNRRSLQSASSPTPPTMPSTCYRRCWSSTRGSASLSRIASPIRTSPPCTTPPMSRLRTPSSRSILSACRSRSRSCATCSRTRCFVSTRNSERMRNTADSNQGCNTQVRAARWPTRILWTKHERCGDPKYILLCIEKGRGPRPKIRSRVRYRVPCRVPRRRARAAPAPVNGSGTMDRTCLYKSIRLRTPRRKKLYSKNV